MIKVRTVEIKGHLYNLLVDDERQVAEVTGGLFNRAGAWKPGLEDTLVRALRGLQIPAGLNGTKHPEARMASFPLIRHVATRMVQGGLRRLVKEDPIAQDIVKEMEQDRRRYFLAREMGLYLPDKWLHDRHREQYREYRERAQYLYGDVEHPYKWFAEEGRKPESPSLAVVSDPLGNYFYTPSPAPKPTTDDLIWLRRQLSAARDRLTEWWAIHEDEDGV